MCTACYLLFAAKMEWKTVFGYQFAFIKLVFVTGGFVWELMSTREKRSGSLEASTGTETGRTVLISTRLYAVVVARA